MVIIFLLVAICLLLLALQGKGARQFVIGLVVTAVGLFIVLFIVGSLMHN